MEFSEQIKILGDRGHNMHFEGPKKLKALRVPGPDKRIEIIRELDDERGDMQELREELDKLRQELKEMKKELKK